MVKGSGGSDFRRGGDHGGTPHQAQRGTAVEIGGRGHRGQSGGDHRRCPPACPALLVTRGCTRYAGAVNRYDKRVWALAAALSALAGFVDATGFLELGGFFVSFMSGNSTRLGVGLVGGASSVAVPAALIALFVVGVVLGSLCGHAAGPRRRPTVLALVAALLAVAALASRFAPPPVAIVFMVLAMGAENAVFEQGGEVQIGLTYMTGTLVKAGQRLALALRGGERWAWVPYLLLWVGLLAGAVAGAMVYPVFGLGGLWLATAAAALLTVAARRS